MTATLLVPDLLLPPDALGAMRGLRLPALEKWLARADVTRAPAAAAYDWLAREYGLPATAPFAAIALAGEGGARDGHWLRADPVHLRIERDQVVLHDASILGIEAEEARALVAALLAHFARDGLELHAPSPERWYLGVPADCVPETTSLALAVGRNIFGLLPRGGGRLNWRSMITEAQMVMSGHEVNERREAAGKQPINSVWFWGGGTAPQRLEPRAAVVYADDPFGRGLALLSGARAEALPRSLGELGEASGDVLIVLDGLTSALRRGELSAWTAAVASLEERWFAGIGDAVKRFGGMRIVLPGENDTLVATIEPASRWRWLRTRKPVNA